MKVYFGGAEKGSYLSILLSAGVDSFGVNLTQLAIPKRKDLILREKFNGGSVLVYTSESDEDLHRFDSFVRQHEEDLEVVICPPNYDGEWLGSKQVPIWNDKEDLERLAWLCQKHGKVALSDRAITGKTLPRINQLHQRWGTKMIALTSKIDSIEAGPWDAVVVGSWTSVIRYGETQVWDGHAMRRYPAQQKESARKKHRADILRLGVDFKEVMDDSVSAMGLLSIRSWLAWLGDDSSGYDPRVIEVTGISMMVTAQGADHTTGNLFNIETKDKDTKELTAASMEVQMMCAAADSLGLCVFGRSVTNINLELITTALNDALGTDLDVGFFARLGLETLELEIQFNEQAGFTEPDDELPAFFYDNPLPPTDKTARHHSAEVNRFRKEWMAAQAIKVRTH